VNVAAIFRNDGLAARDGDDDRSGGRDYLIA